MDTKTLVKNLNRVFSESNNTEKKYLQIWLSEVDFGGLYHSDKFVLNLKAEHRIERYSTELKDIITMLAQKAKEELKYIMHVAVYEPDDAAECESDDYLVYEKETVSP